MLRITALQDIDLVANIVFQQAADPRRGIPPYRQEFRRFTMKKGTTRDDISLVLGIVPEEWHPTEAQIDNNPEWGPLVDVKHPSTGNDAVDTLNLIRIQNL